MDHPILIVDDEPDFLESVRRGLMVAGFRNVMTESDPLAAVERLDRGDPCHLALLDVSMPGMDGVALLGHIKRHHPDVECIMVTARNDAATAVASMKRGAYDYLVKPVDRDDLILTVARTLERRRLMDVVDLGKCRRVPDLARPDAFAGMITVSDRMGRIIKEAELHAGSRVPILITGESGTGKDLLARAVHAASDRADGPYLAVNMASLSPSLFDTEFFGHARGAFTGAEADRAGYLDAAHGGTLVLDEIGILSPELQGKLLRVLEAGEYIRVGTSSPRKIDVRFIALTNEDLESRMAEGAFRKDLYYRLKGAWLHLPPLRERPEDIAPLVEGLLTRMGPQIARAGIRRETMDTLRACPFPGNVRELKHLLASAVNLAQGNPIGLKHLPESFPKPPASLQTAEIDAETIRPLAEVEKAHILAAYRATDRNKARTARLLGIGLNTLRRRLEQWGEG